MDLILLMQGTTMKTMKKVKILTIQMCKWKQIKRWTLHLHFEKILPLPTCL